MTLPGHPTTRIYEQRVTLQKNNEEKRNTKESTQHRTLSERGQQRLYQRLL